MTIDTTTVPTLIKDQVSSLLVQPLEAASVVLSSGVRIFDSSAPLIIPTLTGSTAIGWVGEGEEIPDDHAVTFDEIKLMPTERKSLKMIQRLTAEAARQSHISLDAVLKQRLVGDVSRALDTALLTGDGTDDSITGIINQPDAVQAELDLTTPDTFLDALAVCAAAEVQPTRWFLNAEDFFDVRKLKDGDDRYLLEADLTRDTTYRLFGVPVAVTNKLPSGKAILANMSEVAVVRDTNPTVKVLDQTYATTDEIGIRITCRYDLGLLRPEGVVVLTTDTP